MILALIAVLIAANALFVLLEFGLMRARPARIEILARRGNPRAVAVQDVLSRFDEYLAAIQLCLAAVALALGAVGEPAVTRQINEHFAHWVAWLPPSWLRVLSFSIAVAALACAQMILAELTPRAIAIHYAEPIALYGARPLKALALFLRWPVRWAAACARLIPRLLGLKTAAEADHAATVEEMRVLLGETQDKGAMPLERLIMLENMFDFAGVKASEAMRPREKIVFLSLARPWAENLETIRTKKFSRYPLCELGLDTAIGYVHVKDLLFSGAPEPDLRAARRDAATVAEGDSLETLIKTMPRKGAHLALVRDAAGAIAGLLTVEDILEELVGEVRDEFDRSRGLAAGGLFARAAVDANLPLGDKRSAIEGLAMRLKRGFPGLDVSAAAAAVLDREARFPSAVGRGVLVPHARLPGLAEPIVAVGRYAKPAPFPTPDGVPVRLVFLVLTPAESPALQLRILQRIATLVTNENLRRKLWRAKTDQSLLEILRVADEFLAS